MLAVGNLNSSSWSGGALGYNGQTPDINYSLDLSGLAGKTANLHYEVRDVGDLIIDSALAIDAVKVMRTQDYVSAGGGSFTTLSVKDTTPFGETKGVILLPKQSVTFTFTRFGQEPMGWAFEVSTVSDAFVVTYSLKSTWISGMPANPCY